MRALPDMPAIVCPTLDIVDETEVAALVRAATDGDRQAWDALVGRFEGLVWSVARAHRLSRDDAEDVAQTTWLLLWQNLAKLREPGRVGAWLAATARHESLRLIRRGTREAPTDETGVADRPDEAPAAVDVLDDRERAGILWRALARVDERCQQLLRILAADPRPSYEEISESLAMPIGSIGPTYGRCLDKLRRQAEDLGLRPA